MNNTVILRAYSNQYISLRKPILKKFSLDENQIIRFQLPDICNEIIIGKVIKTTRSRNNEVGYKLSIPKNYIQKHSLNLPANLKLKILEKRRMYSIPDNKSKKGFIDTISLLDRKFTCFENNDDTVTIYFLNKISHSIAVLPRFIKIDEFFLWNIGLYLAEGTKTTEHRVSLANNEPYIVKRFLVTNQ